VDELYDATQLVDLLSNVESVEIFTRQIISWRESVSSIKDAIFDEKIGKIKPPAAS